MAKTMAYITDGTVKNLIWCSDAEPETDTLKNVEDRPVGIGDTYENGKFFRDGVELLTPLEQRIRELEAENADMKAALDHLEVSDT